MHPFVDNRNDSQFFTSSQGATTVPPFASFEITAPPKPSAVPTPPVAPPVDRGSALKAYFQNAEQWDILRNTDSTLSSTRMHSARGGVSDSMVGTSELILPISARPLGVAPEDHSIQVGDGMHGAPSQRELAMVSTDRLGRTVRIYATPLPPAQKEQIVPRNGLKSRLGTLFSRERPRTEVSDAVAPANHGDEAARSDAMTASLHVYSGMDPRYNQTHAKEEAEMDYRRNWDMYERGGYNFKYRSVMRKAVPKTQRDTKNNAVLRIEPGVSIAVSARAVAAPSRRTETATTDRRGRTNVEATERRHALPLLREARPAVGVPVRAGRGTGVAVHARVVTSERPEHANAPPRALCVRVNAQPSAAHVEPGDGDDVAHDRADPGVGVEPIGPAEPTPAHLAAEAPKVDAPALVDVAPIEGDVERSSEIALAPGDDRIASVAELTRGGGDAPRQGTTAVEPATRKLRPETLVETTLAAEQCHAADAPARDAVQTISRDRAVEQSAPPSNDALVYAAPTDGGQRTHRRDAASLQTPTDGAAPTLASPAHADTVQLKQETTSSERVVQYKTVCGNGVAAPLFATEELHARRGTQAAYIPGETLPLRRSARHAHLAMRTQPP